MDIHNVGTMFPNYFSNEVDYFSQFLANHTPQLLTESNKDDVAYRKGVYLSEVSDDNQFKLLRCSTNLQGPTEKFSDLDRSIISKLNTTAKDLYENPAELNHVLAQVYYNHKIGEKSRCARIARHSDKTKDMPKNGIMAFCTFYDSIDNKKYHANPDDPNDVLYKNTSVLTKLRFIRKNNDATLPERFDVLLYPNSAFFIDLNTNRLFTHEIVPPPLPAELIPTRLGYVVRCSKQDAHFVNGQTLIKNTKGKWEPLQPPTAEGVSKLKEQYRIENISTDLVNYDFFNFSLNEGDYLPPKVN